MGMTTDIRFKFHFRTAVLTAAAAVVLMLPVSCNKHNEAPVDNVIGISAFQAGTRAVVNSANDMVSQSLADGTTGFGVYGYKTKGSDNTQIFTNQVVTASGSTDNYTWSYTPLKYWDMSAYYRYVAYWPYRVTGSGASHNEDTHILTLSGIPNWQPAATGDDWLIATSAGEAISYFNRAMFVDGTVYFTFSHLLAQIEVQAWYYGDENKHAIITGLELGDNTHQVPSESGTATFQQNYSATPDASWGPVTKDDQKAILTSNTTALVAFSTDEDNGRIEDLKEITSGVTPVPDVVCTWLVVPFSQADIPLTVSYKIGDSTMDPVTVTTTLGPDIESGKKYILRLKINTKTNQIDLAELWVKDWTDTSVNKEVYNW